MDYRELANRVRDKYPGAYDDLDDKVLAEKIVSKYPQYNDVTFDSSSRSDRSASTIDQIKDMSGYSTSPVGLLEKIPQYISQKAGEVSDFVSERMVAEGADPYLAAGTATFISMGPDILMAGINPELAAAQASKIAPVAGKKGIEIAQKAASLGIELTPAEITGSKSLSLLESVLEKTPFSSGMIRKFRANQLESLVKKREAVLSQNGPKETVEVLGEQIKNQIDNLFNKETKLKVGTATKLKDSFLKKLGSSETYEEIGMAGQEAIKKASQARFGKSQELYNQVDEFIDPALTVSPKNLQAVAKEIMKKEKALPPSMRDAESTRVLMDLARGKKMTWGNINSIRSRLGELIADSDPSYGFSKAGQGTKFVSDKSAATYKRLFGALEKDAETLIKEAGAEAENALDVARSFYKESKQLFGRMDIQRVLKSDPEKVVGMIFKPGSDTEIKMLRQGIGESGFAPLKKKFVSRLLETGEGEIVSPDLIRNRLDRYGETLNTIFSDTEIKQFNDLVGGLQKADAKAMGNPLFKSLLKQRPEKVIDYIVQPKNTANIKAVKKELGDAGMEKVKEGFLSKLLQVEEDGNFSPTRFANRLNAYGDETLKAIFPKDILLDLKKMGEVGRAVGRAEKLAGNPSGTAQNIITGAGLAWAIAHPVSGVSLIVTPMAIAKSYLSAPIRKLLIQGLNLPKGSKEAPAVASRLISYFGSKNQTSEGPR